jgi:hypothetical protein
VPTRQHKHDQRDNSHEGKESEPTAGCAIAPAIRWNIAGVIHLGFFELS